MGQVSGKLEFLASSEARIEILDLLCQENGLTDRELREQVDYSRTTVHRNLDSLLDQGWIRHSNGKYSVTTGGKIVTNQFVDLAETIKIIDQLQPFLKWVPREELNIDITAFRDAKITAAEPGNALAMVNRHVQQLKETTDGRAVLPTMSLHPYEVAHDRVLRGELKGELIVKPEIAETFTSNPDFEKLTQEMLSTDDFDIYIYEEDIPYYLGILDETVQLGADENGQPRALVESTSDEVRQWAENKYSKYKENARRIS